MNKEHFKRIKRLFQDKSVYNFSDAEHQEMKDAIALLCHRGVLQDLEIDNANAYRKVGEFEIFEKWYNEQDRQEKKELRRNRRHDVFMLVLGAVLGSIFTGVVEFILFKFFGIGG